MTMILGFHIPFILIWRHIVLFFRKYIVMIGHRNCYRTLLHVRVSDILLLLYQNSCKIRSSQFITAEATARLVYLRSTILGTKVIRNSPWTPGYYLTDSMCMSAWLTDWHVFKWQWSSMFPYHLEETETWFWAFILTSPPFGRTSGPLWNRGQHWDSIPFHMHLVHNYYLRNLKWHDQENLLRIPSFKTSHSEQLVTISDFQPYLIAGLSGGWRGSFQKSKFQTAITVSNLSDSQLRYTAEFETMPSYVKSQT